MNAPPVGGVGLLALLAFAGARAADAAPDPRRVALDAPPTVSEVRVEDVDGDGGDDLVVLAGREVRIWRGQKAATLAPVPTWRIPLPESASFVDVGPPSRRDGGAAAPTLLAVAGSEVVRLAPDAPPSPVPGIALDSDWGGSRPLLSDFAREGQLVLPSARGWRWIPRFDGSAEGVEIVQAPRRVTTAPGAFLDEGATVAETWGVPVASAGAGGAPTLWILGPSTLQSFAPGSGAAGRTFPIDFLTNDAGRSIRNRLVELDGDGLPDLCHEATSNLDGVYAFFGTPAAGGGDTFGAARGILRLSGYQLPPAYPDLDGDQRPDLVVTTIEIDAGNTMRALGGRVTAKTKAFLNRSGAGRGDFFPGKPDAERESDVGVAIRFSYTGAIDVERSYTILADADLDGDGRRELVIRTGRDAIAVWRGAGSGVWAQEPRNVEIPALEPGQGLDAHAADLTGDGRDDLVLVYGATPAAAARLIVLVSP